MVLLLLPCFNHAIKWEINSVAIAHVINTKYGLSLMMIHATFNNISAISLSSVLLVEEIEIFGENHRPVASHHETLLHNV
jgi:hypothetical protein